ncbi:unnamed protein product [Rotaria magnacalcarata]|uniref:Uncharacterized protein n=1 Tax=Rotaria magnacalcarata TaxID=392030 RepID=A0A816CIW8_9BILA|nr:unnamed protein product [Rotaria magnacalcarata]CAF2221375.1 unnamed protein product [Rotaria magnacalcarata]
MFPTGEPNNTSNERIQDSNVSPSSIPNQVYSDYESDESMTVLITSNFNGQPSYAYANFPACSTEQIYINDYINQYNNEFYEYSTTNIADGDIPDELQNELEAAVDQMTNEPVYDNDEDETIYSDDVQNAFDQYENEYSQFWNQNTTTWNNLPDNEEEEMLEQMKECMRYMEQKYSVSDMPNDSNEIYKESCKLNPEAAEFRPFNFQPLTSIDEEANVALSSVPSEAKQPEEHKDI